MRSLQAVSFVVSSVRQSVTMDSHCLFKRGLRELIPGYPRALAKMLLRSQIVLKVPEIDSWEISTSKLYIDFFLNFFFHRKKMFSKIFFSIFFLRFFKISIFVLYRFSEILCVQNWCTVFKNGPKKSKSLNFSKLYLQA